MKEQLRRFWDNIVLFDVWFDFKVKGEAFPMFDGHPIEVIDSEFAYIKTPKTILVKDIEDLPLELLTQINEALERHI